MHCNVCACVCVCVCVYVCARAVVFELVSKCFPDVNIAVFVIANAYFVALFRSNDLLYTCTSKDGHHNFNPLLPVLSIMKIAEHTRGAYLYCNFSSLAYVLVY